VINAIDSANNLLNADLSVGIVVALPEELATLTTARLKQGECCKLGVNWIVYSGAGLKNAAAAARLLTTKGVNSLVSWGCAAGLHPQAKPGDLVIAAQVTDAKHSFEANKNLGETLKNALPDRLTIFNGNLYTSSTLVHLSQDKQSIYQLSQAVALDMESVAIAEVAKEAQLPFLVVRSIADPVNMDLPQAVVQALNAEGQVNLPKLLGYLSWHPLEIPALIRLGKHFKAAQNTLKIVAQVLQKQQAIISVPTN
jgi:adenosylhomocysteine nucleosidase